MLMRPEGWGAERASPCRQSCGSSANVQMAQRMKQIGGSVSSSCLQRKDMRGGEWEGTYEESTELNGLCGSVGGMACKEEVVSRLNPPSETHKDGGVGAESSAHGTRDHLFILGEIGNSCKRKTPVGNRTPEVCRL